ncbi:hypothetical protein NCAS_0F01890 [Naumovozyma castellii]|uniref:YMR122W-A n=1 Tax=Naumovozyma castellii TaxID=27288 RepID=G0VGQ2_NAUCA|nr:hypothetical protein NCAS_0F01890 [Naumovozyma castellii CBS 4309]CCC70673.1 hypothetical protein NCAS_0F01890 [Naumovozyma castellii CBS 4309]
MASSTSSHSSVSSSSSVHTNSNLVSAAVVSASSVSATSTHSTTTSKNSKNAAPGMVANPVSWKYGVALGAVLAGSFVLGAGI